MPKPNKWSRAIERRAAAILMTTAWRKAQKLRQYLEHLTVGFFEELVSVGLDTEGPPSLGIYTPNWEPLSENWAARKGHDNFYYATGALERTLLRKSTVGVFGRPQVFLDFGGRSVKVTAAAPAPKYEQVLARGLSIRMIPFPRLGQDGDISTGEPEELVSGGNSTVYYKLSNPKHTFQRPLVSPFIQWYLHDKIRKAVRNLK